MIRINFALRKTATAGGEDPAAAAGGGGGFSLKNLFKSKGPSVPSVQVQDLRELPLTGLLVAIAVGVLGSLLVDSVKTEEMAKESEITKKLETQIAELQKAVAKKKDKEQQKREMEDVERLYRVKIKTIETLAADRQAAAKTFQAISRLLPAEVWLTNVKLNDQEVGVQGMAKSLSYFTDFVRNLNSSAEFTDATPLQAQTQRDPVFGEAAATFNLAMKRQKR